MRMRKKEKGIRNELALFRSLPRNQFVIEANACVSVCQSWLLKNVGMLDFLEGSICMGQVPKNAGDQRTQRLPIRKQI